MKQLQVKRKRRAKKVMSKNFSKIHEKNEDKTNNNPNKSDLGEFFGEENLSKHSDIENKNNFLQNQQKNSEKIDKKSKNKELKKVLSKDKFSKKVISARVAELKRVELKKQKNNKRLNKCNRVLLANRDSENDIYFMIDKFNNNGKKTIVYFNDSWYPVIDGVVAVVDNYASKLNEEYNIVICVPKHKNKIASSSKYLVLGADSVFVKSQGYDIAFPQFDVRFKKYLSLLKIDLVHIHSPFSMGSFGLQLAKHRKVPSFVTFHSKYKQNFSNAVKSEAIANILTSVIANVFKKATVALTMNSYAKKIMNSYGIKRNIEIIPNATDLCVKDFDPKFENEILNKHKINKNEFNILFIGRFVEVKNVYFIIDVLGELVKINKNFKYIFVGYGPEQEKMKKTIKQKGLEENIIFTGKIDSGDEKAVIIKNSTLLFFPSTYDTDGIVKIECACYGVPTLCVEDTGVSANIINDRNGFVEKEDVSAFVKRLDFLIKNVDYVKKIGKNANLDIYITWNDVCLMLDKIYQKYLKTYNFKHTKKNKDKSAKKV